MKKLILLILIVMSFPLLGQSPDLNQRLYYTCKIWGYAKYFHSEVSNCNVNWDSVLAANLYAIGNAADYSQFNDVLINILNAAGEMEIAETDPPDDIPSKLRINLVLDWFDDGMIRDDVRGILYNIKENFRPHENCYVTFNNGSGYGLLYFPKDDPIIDENLYTNYPDENTRLAVLFRYWNIMNYFNPYSDILDQPWDSCLVSSIPDFIGANEYSQWQLAIKKLAAGLNDAHVEGLTYSREKFVTNDVYRPHLILGLGKKDYIVMKSDYPEISRGDVVLSVDGKSMKEWEDSLGVYISAGSHDIKRRYIALYSLLGESNDELDIEFMDDSGNNNKITLGKNFRYDSWFADYYINPEMKWKKYHKWDCNVGYVNMGELVSDDVTLMYNYLFDTKAIIFDIRNYPNGTIYDIGNIIYKISTHFVTFSRPDVQYPGTLTEIETSIGTASPVYYKGKVIILCNETTQSHAEFTCMGLQAMPDVYVIGSQTAGADGNVTAFDISNDFMAGFTSLGVFYPDGGQTQRTGIRIDSVMYPTPEGIRNNRDELLEYALEVAGCDPNNVFEEEFISSMVFPNPADEFITLPGVDGNIFISDITGRVLIKTYIDNNTRIPVSKLAKGLYFVYFADGMQYFIKD